MIEKQIFVVAAKSIDPGMTKVCKACKQQMPMPSARRLILMASNQETWQVTVTNDMDDCEIGQRLVVPIGKVSGPLWDGFGFKLARKMPNAPKAVIDKVMELIDPCASDYYNPAQDSDPPMPTKEEKS